MDEGTDQQMESQDDKCVMLSIDGENHTLGNAMRDVMWLHPHVQLASYTQEHPSSTEIVVQCQTTGAISAEQGVVEALQVTKEVLAHMDDTMAAAVEEYESRSGGQQAMSESSGGG